MDLFSQRYDVIFGIVYEAYFVVGEFYRTIRVAYVYFVVYALFYHLWLV
jgi:hypothetical protein